MNIDIKLKTYEQLQNEVITLNTNSYLKDLKIRQLQSNWNSLREWVEKDNTVFETNFKMGRCVNFKDILDKMNELEREDK